MNNKIVSVAENAAAISDRVHSQPAKYREFYDLNSNKLSGFTGIWTLIAECAVELDRQHQQEWDGDWIETCWAIGDLILSLQQPANPEQLVSQALEFQQRSRKGASMNQPKKRTATRKRDHLFSPHTDLCIYCGQSAEDDRVENTPCGSGQSKRKPGRKKLNC